MFKIVLLIFITNFVFANDSEVAIKLHSIFNKKLVTPLKLDSDKSEILLEKLNSFSKQMLKLEDNLKTNLKYVKHEITKKKIDKDALETLMGERIDLIDKLNALEKKKLNEIKNILSIRKFAYYLVLKEKLILKFKKAIKIEELAEIK